jgi:hypothetical protein
MREAGEGDELWTTIDGVAEGSALFAWLRSEF